MFRQKCFQKVVEKEDHLEGKVKLFSFHARPLGGGMFCVMLQYTCAQTIPPKVIEDNIVYIFEFYLAVLNSNCR